MIVEKFHPISFQQPAATFVGYRIGQEGPATGDSLRNGFGVVFIEPAIQHLNIIDMNLPRPHQVKSDPQICQSFHGKIIKMDGEPLPLRADLIGVLARR